VDNDIQREMQRIAAERAVLESRSAAFEQQSKEELLRLAQELTPALESVPEHRYMGLDAFFVRDAKSYDCANPTSSWHYDYDGDTSSSPHLVAADLGTITYNPHDRTWGYDRTYPMTREQAVAEFRTRLATWVLDSIPAAKAQYEFEEQTIAFFKRKKGCLAFVPILLLPFLGIASRFV
jgi:hypothetical protein